MKKLVQQWITKYIAQEVPSELAVCEFECNEVSCNQQKRMNCELWKSYNRSLKAPFN